MDRLRSVRPSQLVNLGPNCAVDTRLKPVVGRHLVRTYYPDCSSLLLDLELAGMAAAVVVA